VTKEEEQQIAESNLQAEDQEAKSGEEPEPIQEAHRRLSLADRIQALAEQRFITRGADFEETIFDKKKTIDRKFHLIGHAHKRIAWVRIEMIAELETFLYELAGHVPKALYDRSINEVRQWMKVISESDQLEQVNLLYSRISQVFFEIHLGIKQPVEKSVFDLDVDKIFEGHLVRLQEAKQKQIALTHTQKVVEEIVRK